MENYKKKIYKLWGEKNPETFPYPEEKLIKEKTEYYRKCIIERFFPKNKDINILDIGCGYGLFLNACQKIGYKNVFGVEIDEKCIELAKKKFAINSIVNSEIFDYLKSKEDKSFDIITAFDVIEHFKKEEILDLLNLIYKKLKDNGIFIMRVPNAGSLPGLYIFHSDLTHEIGFTDLLIKELFHLIGFSRVELVPECRPMLKNLFLNIIRCLLSTIFSFFKNEFVFSTNIIAMGHK